MLSSRASKIIIRGNIVHTKAAQLYSSKTRGMRAYEHVFWHALTPSSCQTSWAWERAEIKPHDSICHGHARHWWDQDKEDNATNELHMFWNRYWKAGCGSTQLWAIQSSQIGLSRCTFEAFKSATASWQGWDHSQAAVYQNLCMYTFRNSNTIQLHAHALVIAASSSSKKPLLTTSATWTTPQQTVWLFLSLKCCMIAVTVATSTKLTMFIWTSILTIANEDFQKPSMMQHSSCRRQTCTVVDSNIALLASASASKQQMTWLDKMTDKEHRWILVNAFIKTINNCQEAMQWKATLLPLDHSLHDTPIATDLKWVAEVLAKQALSKLFVSISRRPLSSWWQKRRSCVFTPPSPHSRLPSCDLHQQHQMHCLTWIALPIISTVYER